MENNIKSVFSKFSDDIFKKNVKKTHKYSSFNKGTFTLIRITAVVNIVWLKFHLHDGNVAYDVRYSLPTGKIYNILQQIHILF